jgi:outer membrane lipoprotein-sorting protein
MRCRAIAVFATVVLLSGCASRPAPRPSSAPTDQEAAALPPAARILAALAQRRATLRGVRAIARLSYTSPEESRRAKQLVIVERPDRLRFEILSPFGAVFVLAAADGTLAAWARDESTVYRGSASAENLQRYAQVDLPVATAVDLLLGTPPLDAELDSVVSADDGAVELWQDTGRDVQVLWVTLALEPLRYEQRATDGRVLLRATFGEYIAIDGVRVPTRLGIELPPAQRRIEIALSDTEVNPPLPDAVFALETPAGSKEVNLDDGVY